jgi:hypothetical protein
VKVLISYSFVNRTKSIREYPPWKNRLWVGASIAAIVLQFTFSAASIGITGYSMNRIPWYVYLLCLSWPFVFLPIQELVKAHDSKEYARFQKRSRLEFSTKLGTLFFGFVNGYRNAFPALMF